MRDELDVVDPIRNAAELRRVVRDEPADVHRERGLGRERRRSGLHGQQGDTQCGPALQRRVQHGLLGTGGVELNAGQRRHDVDARVDDGERRVARLLLDALAEPAKPVVGRGAAHRERRRAAVRQVEERRKLPRRDQPARLAEPELDRSRERHLCLPRCRRERRGAHARGLNAERQLDSRRAPFERAELLHHRPRSGFTVEDAARPRRLDGDLRAVAHELGVPRCAVHVLRNQRDLIVERAVQHGRRRRHVGPEHLHVEPLEAPNRAEAVALALRRVDRGLPVGLDTELGGADRVVLAAGQEDDRLVRHRVRAPLQEGAGVLRAHAADVDAVDAHARGERRGRPCEDKAENDYRRRDRDQQHNEAAAHAPNVARPLARGLMRNSAGPGCRP